MQVKNKSLKNYFGICILFLSVFLLLWGHSSTTVHAAKTASKTNLTQNGKSMLQLKKQLKKMVHRYSGSWSVYVKDLKSGASLCINNRIMYPASTIKAFVMAATFDKINRGKLSYRSVKSQLHQMITISDNEAYNELVRRNGKGNFKKGTASINKFLKNNGFKRTRCHSTLHPSGSRHVSDGHRNTATARECGLLLEKIYRGEIVSRKYSKMMLSLLKKQTRKWKIPSGLPRGIRSANKTGETNSVQHDMAIVYGKKTNYIICIFSTTGEGNGVRGIRNISRKVYSYLNS